MIRLVIFIGVLIAVFFGGLYATYGQIEPCRALAVERARHMVGSTASGIVEPVTRAGTSQMSTGACVRGLADAWIARL